MLPASTLALTYCIQAPINAHFEALFETGVDEMNWDVVGDDNVSLLLLLLLLLLQLLMLFYFQPSILLSSSLEQAVVTITGDRS